MFEKLEFEILDEKEIYTNCGTKTKYSLRVSYAGKSYDFEYTESVMAHRNNEPVEFERVMECLLLDANAYNNTRDIDDFQREFGYEKVSECLDAYEGCKKTAMALKEMFTEEDIEELEKEVYED